MPHDTTPLDAQEDGSENEAGKRKSKDKGKGGESGSGGGGGGGRGGRRKSSEEVEYWKTRFEELAAVGETAAEKELRVYREHAAERDRAAQEIIANLR